MLGARGLGAAGGYELERFTWTGTYRREDFITPEGRALTWDEVKPTLVSRGLDVLKESARLRGLLGAVETDTDASWNLVPLAEASDYRRFSQTFQRLLQLRDIKQDHLKQLLADCAKLGPSEREIDLAKEFEKELAAIARDRSEITRLRAATPLVKELRALHDEEFVTRALAHAVVKELNERYAGYHEKFTRDAAALVSERERAQREYSRLEEERKKLLQERTETDKQAGRVGVKLEALEKAAARFADLVPEVEQQVRVNLGDEVANLRGRLADLPNESPDILTRQLEGKALLLDQRRKSVARLSDFFINWLRARLPEKSIESLGSLLDRNVFEAVMNERINVLDENGLLDRLKKLAEQCDARGYQDDFVEIEFLPGSRSSVQKIGRLEQLQEEIRDLQRQTEKLARDIETLRNAKPFRDRLVVVEFEYNQQIQKLGDYARYREELDQKSDYLEQLGRWTAKSAKLGETLQANETARNAVTQTSQSALDRADKLQKENNAIREQAKSMPCAEGDDPGATAVSDAFVKDLSNSLLEVFQKAREKCARARNLADQLRDKAGLLDKDFVTASFLYDLSAPLTERLQRLENEISSVEERAISIEQRWTAVLAEARSCFNAILKSLDAIVKQARKLTNELGKVEFSSISQVRLEVVLNQAAVAEYERHAKDAAQPSLFDTSEEADLKLSQFHALLKRRPKLVLNDLFSLCCEVTRKDGLKNKYDDFDQVESTGTTIVLKVTLNLLVLRDLLIPGRARIPYYLDEVHALDRQNLNNIIQLSQRLGFVGIYAAPTAAIGPRRFVHLVPDAKGRLIVTAAHRKDILRAPEDIPNP